MWLRYIGYFWLISSSYLLFFILRFNVSVVFWKDRASFSIWVFFTYNTFGAFLPELLPPFSFFYPRSLIYSSQKSLDKINMTRTFQLMSPLTTLWQLKLWTKKKRNWLKYLRNQASVVSPSPVRLWALSSQRWTVAPTVKLQMHE